MAGAALDEIRRMKQVQARRVFSHSEVTDYVEPGGIVIMNREGERQISITPGCYIYYACGEEDLIGIDELMRPIDVR